MVMAMFPDAMRAAMLAAVPTITVVTAHGSAEPHAWTLTTDEARQIRDQLMRMTLEGEL